MFSALAIVCSLGLSEPICYEFIDTLGPYSTIEECEASGQIFNHNLNTNNEFVAFVRSYINNAEQFIVATKCEPLGELL